MSSIELACCYRQSALYVVFNEWLVSHDAKLSEMVYHGRISVTITARSRSSALVRFHTYLNLHHWEAVNVHGRLRNLNVMMPCEDETSVFEEITVGKKVG